MCIKFIFGIITMIIVILSSQKINQDLEQNNVVLKENNVQNIIITENTVVEDCANKVEESTIHILEKESIMQTENKENNSNKIKSKTNTTKITTSEGSKKTTTTENKNVVKRKESKDKVETKIETEITETVKENRNEEKTEDVEEKKIEEQKETIKEIEKVKNEPIYNATETLKMVAAIDKYAKQNEYLFNENGEKLYNIRISEDAMQYDYFSPYRDNQIEAKVANVFSCTFIVYAVDVKNTTKYYIGIE